MLRAIWHLMYGYPPVTFESDFGMEESVRRLAEGSSRWRFTWAARAVGKVTEGKVRLWRGAWFPLDSGGYIRFGGRFETMGDKVVLRGRFSPDLINRIFCTALLVPALAISIWITVVNAIRLESVTEWGIVWLFPAGVALFYSIFPYLSRGDIIWLSDHIRARLQPGSPEIQ